MYVKTSIVFYSKDFYYLRIFFLVYFSTLFKIMKNIHFCSISCNLWYFFKFQSNITF